MIDPKKGLKSIAKAGKKSYKFDEAEPITAPDEMDHSGEFSDVELDDAALVSLMRMDGSATFGNASWPVNTSIDWLRGSSANVDDEPHETTFPLILLDRLMCLDVNRLFTARSCRQV